MRSRAEELAGFVLRAESKHLSPEARLELKLRVLDALGCALGALEGEPIALLRVHFRALGEGGPCALFGAGRSAADRAAFYNAALVRYLDFNDSFLAPGETCHPSDNLGAVLAASELAGRSGEEFLVALAVAYEVQCRLSEAAPVRRRGFDHTTQGAYAVAAGVSKALDLELEPTVNAIAICGTAFNALRVTRTGALSHWKGLAYPNMASCCTHAALLAANGITGPREVFEGNKGFMETISGPFEVSWVDDSLERVRRTAIKKYNAEVHSQSAIEGLLDLRAQAGFHASEIERIEVDVFDVAWRIIGSGEEGDKTVARSKEEADHSLPWLLAAAAIDGMVMPEQYLPERIAARDVQDLLRRVRVRPADELSARFPAEMPCRLRVRLAGGREFGREKRDYEGFPSRPMSAEGVTRKFQRLAGRAAGPELCDEIVDRVLNLEVVPIAKLMESLSRVGRAPTSITVS